MSAFVLHDRYTDPESGRISSYFSQLFLIIGKESVCYATLDTEKNTFVSLSEYRVMPVVKIAGEYISLLDQFFSQESMLMKKYPAAVAGIATPFHTLVPSALFDPSKLDNYLKFNFRLTDGFLAASDPIEESGAHNVYGFLPGLKEMLRNHFRDAVIVHRSSAFLKAVSLYDKLFPSVTALYLHISDESSLLACFDEQKPVFFNSFPAGSREDLLYFLLYTLEQLKQRPEAVRLTISGMVREGSDDLNFLRQYIPDTGLVQPLPQFGYSAMLRQAPLHRYLDLFALALCGS